MEPMHLRAHEVNYELRVRGIATTGSDMPQKRKFLRRELRKDQARPGVHVYELPNFTFDTEKSEIEESLKSVTSMVDDFDGMNSDVHERIMSRLTHLIGRVKRIPDNTSEEISGYKGDQLILVSALEGEVEEIMERHAQAVINRPNTSTVPDAVESSKPFPVHKWNVKFDGTPKCSLNAFLEQVEELSFARNVSESSLFRSAVELFEGPAKVWYRSIRTRVNTWTELVVALRRDFLPKDADDDLWATIRNRMQKKDEKVVIYIAAMENLFSRLITKATNSEKLKVIKKNLLEEYHVHLALREITTVDQLTDTCRTLESAGIIKVASYSENSSRRNTSSLEPDLNHLPTRNLQDRHTANKTSRVDVNELRCFKCKQIGHLKRDCRVNTQRSVTSNRRSPSCFGCGKQGVIKPNCPNCSKNGRAGGAQ